MEHSGWRWRSLALTTAWSYRLGPRVQVWSPALLRVRLQGGAWGPACDQGVAPAAEPRLLRSPCSGWEPPTRGWCTTPVTAPQMPHQSSCAGKCAACMRNKQLLPAQNGHQQLHLSRTVATVSKPNRCHPCSVVFDIGTHARLRVLPRPVYSVAPDGTLAASFCFLRLHITEPGALFTLHSTE
jgi:hypothetical protein